MYTGLPIIFNYPVYIYTGLKIIFNYSVYIYIYISTGLLKIIFNPVYIYIYIYLYLYMYGFIQNDRQNFNNLSHTIHFR
jgi:hypothetical protein